MNEIIGVFEELRSQELIIIWPPFGTDRTVFETMVDSNFFEIGASGKRYDREHAINVLLERSNKRQDENWEMKEFSCLEIGNSVYLLTYMVMQETRITRRSSIWYKSDSQWKIVYHQGTLVQ